MEFLLYLLFHQAVVSDALRPHGQHARLPHPLLCPGACLNSCPLSWWCHPTISFSAALVSSCSQSFPAEGLFQWVTSLHQLGKVLELQIQHHFFQWIFRVDWIFRIDLFDLLAVQGTLKSLLQHHSSKALILQCSAFFMVQLSHPYMTTGKTITLTIQTFANKVLSLLFNTLSRYVIAFFPRSKHLLITWLQSRSTVTLESNKIQSLTVSVVFPSICREVMGLDAMIFVFWMLSFKPAFSLPSFTFIKRLFGSSLLSAIRVMSSGYLRLLIFLLAILIPVCVSSSLAFRVMYSA